MGIGQSGKPAVIHADSQIQPLNMRGRDSIFIWFAVARFLRGAYYLGRTVAGGFLSRGVLLYNHDSGAGAYIRLINGFTTAGSLATATITDSTFSENTAEVDGGGIFALLSGNDTDADGVYLAVKNSTISGNSSTTASSGGVYVCEKFGATFVADHTTVSGNSAYAEGRGIALARYSNSLISGFDATISHSTITQNESPNGGGVYSDTAHGGVDVKLSHNIISGNDDGSGTANNVIGAIDEAMSQFNFIGPNGVAVFHEDLPESQDNIHDSNNDPELHDLVFNGGFAKTETHLPEAGSPVIDAGDQNISGEPDHDQRGIGFARRVGTTIDIGAVEYRVGAPRVVDVEVSGSDSMHKPFSFARGTYDDPDTTQVETIPYMGSGYQLRNVPVGLADTYTVHFDEKMDEESFENDSLTMIGLRFADEPTLATDVTVAPDGYSATWQFTNVSLEGDHYLIRLEDSITDLEDNNLDGDWTNPGEFETVNSAVSKFPSGDGSAGGDFNFVALILPGDLNLNGIIDADDAGDMFANWAASIPVVASSFGLGDINGNGLIDAADASLMFTNWSESGQETEVYDDFTVVLVAADWDGDGLVEAGDEEDDRDGFETAFGDEEDAADLNRDGEHTQADLDIFNAFEDFGIVVTVVT